MNENTATFPLPGANASPQALVTRVYETANVLLVPSSTPDRLHLFAARSVANDTDVLVEIRVHEGQATVKVNCDKIVIGSMLLKDLKAALVKV
jgi:AP-3 complex subunit beta